MEEHARQEAAEQVRAHLVSLRGGAPFLSSADGQLLLRWLDAEVPVAHICAALELAAEARRKRPSRIPLSLSHAKRHLTKVPEPAPVAVVSQHPFQSLTVLLRQATGPSAPPLHDLASELLAMAPGEDLLEQGLSALQRTRERLWTELSADLRRRAIDEQVSRLGDVPATVDPSVVLAAAEEQARLHHLSQWPWLSTFTLIELAA